MEEYDAGRTDHGRGPSRPPGTADAQTGRVPALLRGRAGHDRERTAGRVRLSPRLGRLRALLAELTGSNTSGLGHAAFRARSPQALHRRVAALQASGQAVGWHEGELGHGPAFQFRDPDGHLLEIYYETEWYQAPDDLRPSLKNQAQRFPARGVNVRRLDHFNCLAADIKANREFFQGTLGFRLTEQIVLDDGTEVGMWLTATNKSYDFAYTREAHGVKGRFHHITFALDSREAILQA